MVRPRRGAMTKKSKHPKKEIISSTTTFTDLNVQCIEYILRKLELDDLSNIADTNKKLRSIAQAVFAIKYSKYIFDIFIFNKMYGETQVPEYRDRIPCNELRPVLKLLRCFGQVITTIKINNSTRRDYYKPRIEPNICDDPMYRKWHQNVLRVYSYAMNYCTENLKKIVFENMTKDVIEFIKPFAKVETVQFQDCDLEENLTNFNKWFPNMRSLILQNCQIVDHSCIEHHFPLLKKLELFTCFNLEPFAMDSIDTVLRMNTHLTELALSCDTSGRLLKSVIQHLPKIEKLGVYWDTFTKQEEFEKLSAYNGDSFYFENVKHFELNICAWESHADVLPKIPLLFGRLERFDLNTNCISSDNLIEFLHQNSSIKVFVIGYVGLVQTMEMNKNHKLKIVAALPFLEKFHHPSTYDIDEILAFLKKAKSLKLFWVRDTSNHGNNLKLLQKYVRNEWSVEQVDPWKLKIKRLNNMTNQGGKNDFLMQASNIFLKHIQELY